MDDEAGFTPLDRAAIASCVDAYPAYTVEFSESGGIGYALLRGGMVAGGPEVVLTRREGLTGFAATWPDGRTLRAGLNASLALALSFIAQVLDDAGNLFASDDPPDCGGCLGPA